MLEGKEPYVAIAGQDSAAASRTTRLQRAKSAVATVSSGAHKTIKKYTFLKYLSSGSSYKFALVALHISGLVLFFCLVPGENWNFVDALYFSIVTLTTVGYGANTPKTEGGRWFIAFHVIFGLCIVFSLLSSIMQGLWDSHEKFILQLLDEGPRGKKEVEILKQPSKGAFLVALTGYMFLFALGIGIGIAIEGWTFSEAFYFACISATTVGYGDIHPRSDGMKLFAVFWLVLLTLSLGNVITEWQSYQLEKMQLATKRRVLNKHWTIGTIKEYDTDRDGKVSELEFLVKSLVDMQIVERKDIRAIRNQFDQRDIDNSGTISVSDVTARQSLFDDLR